MRVLRIGGPKGPGSQRDNAGLRRALNSDAKPAAWAAELRWTASSTASNTAGLL